MTIKNVIFDWSGVISNDLAPVFEGTMIVFERFGLTPVTLEEFQRTFVLPYMDFYRMHSPDIRKEDADGIFRSIYPTLTPPVLYAGVPEVLEALKKSGIRMIVLSSHYSDALVREAEAYGIRDYFSEINGGIVDKTEAIAGIMQRNGFKPPETVYVGDMMHDIRAAQTARVISAAITWGYQDEERLSSARPDYIIHTLNELPALLRSI